MGNTHIRSPKGQGVSLSGDDQSSDRFAEIFDIDGLLRAADPCEIHPVLVIDCATLEILGGNRAVARVFGHSIHELRGLTPARLHVDADSYRTFRRLVRTALRGGRPHFTCHYPLRRQDGDVFAAEVTVTFVSEIAGNRLVYVCETQDLAALGHGNAHPTREASIRDVCAQLPGALFQRVHAPDGSFKYTFLQGEIIDRLGLDAAAVREDATVLLDRLPAADRARFLESLRVSAETMTLADVNLQLQGASGDVVHVRSLSQPRRLDDGSVIWDGMFLDITDGKSGGAAVAPLRDHLTGLPNLAAFRRFVDERVARAGNPFLLALINIRRLHVINQTYGVETTNALIRAVAQRLDRLDDKAVLARTYRGDFAVLVEGALTDAQRTAMAQQLAGVFEQPFALEGSDNAPLHVSPSIGLVVSPEHGTTTDELLFHLDAASNLARTGNSPCVFYSDDLVHPIREELRLEGELRTAIAEGHIRPHYQPQVDLASREIVGYEALARWTMPDGRAVSPLQFIALAEQAGLVGDLGRSIIRQVIADIRRMHKPPVVSINISGLHLAEDGFETWYLQTLQDAGVGVDAILLEVTESTFMLDFERARRQMVRLREAGVRFSMDDFGTGYSSLSYLTQLPFDAIKIDRSFITGVASDAQKQALVKSVIHIADALKLCVVAEGVETGEQVVALQNLGCRYAQGYHFGRPQPIDEFMPGLEPVS